MIDSTRAHFLMSSYREAVLEHLFVGELLRHLWQHGPVHAEVARPMVDDSGYDVVITANGKTRHIQLKASFRGSRTSRQNVNLRLGMKSGGCVVWMRFDQATLELGPFLFFGGPPGRGLPALNEFKVARTAKADSTGYKKEREAIRVIPKRSFREIGSMADLVQALFGKLPRGQRPG